MTLFIQCDLISSCLSLTFALQLLLKHEFETPSSFEDIYVLSKNFIKYRKMYNICVKVFYRTNNSNPPISICFLKIQILFYNFHADMGLRILIAFEILGLL